MAAARFQFRVARSADEGTGTHVTWRLLATNNRDLGRSSTVFPDLVTCEAAVLRLRRENAALQAVTTRTGPTSWSWRIIQGDTVVAVSSRAYQRRIQADYAGGVVLALIPEADIAAFRPGSAT